MHKYESSPKASKETTLQLHSLCDESKYSHSISFTLRGFVDFHCFCCYDSDNELEAITTYVSRSRHGDAMGLLLQRVYCMWKVRMNAFSRET